MIECLKEQDIWVWNNKQYRAYIETPKSLKKDGSIFFKDEELFKKLQSLY